MPVDSLLAVERLLRGKIASSNLAAVRQLLVLEYLVPLGCCVHLTPLFEAVKQCRPDIGITVATRGLGAQVLRHSPYIDNLIDTPDPLTNLAEAVGSLRRRLRVLNISPDCVLTGASDQRTRIALLAALGAAGWRGGYTVHPAFYHRPLAYDRGLSLIANNLRLASLLGCAPSGVEPHVFFSSDDLQTAQTLLQQANPAGRPVVVMVTQNSGGQRTGWHTERFADVIDHASRQLGCSIVYVGTSTDATAIESIRHASGGIGVSVAGKTSITELAALLALSDAIVSLDTGTMHVGRGVGTPMVVLGPSWQKPIEWMPLSVPNARILRGADRDSIPEDYRLDEISSGAVLSALEEILRTYPPSTEAREARIKRRLSHVDHWDIGA